MIFLVITLIGMILTIILGLRKKYALKQPKRYFKLMALIALILSLISGIVEGTSYSHGVDIAWWIYSVLSFIIIMLTTIILRSIIRLKLF